MDKARFLTIQETAELLRLHEMTIRKMANRGALPACRFGRAVRIDARRLEQQIEAELDRGKGAGR